VKIVFFGTPEYVVPVLDKLNKVYKSKSGDSPISAVVTQRPKPVGRKQQLEYSPVDSWAHKRKIPIFFDAGDILEKRVQADLGVLASFGQILPGEVIHYFPNGIINLHPSLLPKFRGASPIPGAIVLGEKETGLTFTKMNVLLDKGQLVSQFKEEIYPEDTSETLRERLFMKASDILPSLIPAYIAGKTNLKDLGHVKGTFTWMIKKDDALIPPEFIRAAVVGKTFKRKWKIPFIGNYSTRPSALVIHNFVRAMQPWPQAWTYVVLTKGSLPKRLKILKGHLEGEPERLVLDEVQLEGKEPVTWKQFASAYTTATFE
jgi:methionyl-tRNA formyltransferase